MDDQAASRAVDAETTRFASRRAGLDVAADRIDDLRAQLQVVDDDVRAVEALNLDDLEPALVFDARWR